MRRCSSAIETFVPRQRLRRDRGSARRWISPFRASTRRHGKIAVLRDPAVPIFHNYEPRIAPAESEGSDRVLRQVRIDRQAGVLDVAHELWPVRYQISQCLAEFARGHGLVLHATRPLMQGCKLRYGVFPADSCAFFVTEILNLPFDQVERLEEPSPRVNIILSAR
jgi:hypothetical protein